jgi:alpha-1,2-mannosyltransferase
VLRLTFRPPFSLGLFYSSPVECSFLLLLFFQGLKVFGTQLLYSTFVMYILMITMGIWLTKDISYKYPLIILTSGVAAIIGWPFCIIAIFPIALDTIHHYGFIPSLNVASGVSIGLLSLTSWVDSFYYKRIFFTPIHLLLYNKGSGSEKYGVEPFHFYFKNLTLNFNIMFWIGLIAPTGLLSSSTFKLKNILYL